MYWSQDHVKHTLLLFLFLILFDLTGFEVNYWFCFEELHFLGLNTLKISFSTEAFYQRSILLSEKR